jgi:hypothetical protein
MATMTILLGSILLLGTLGDDDDPEPPRPGPVSLKLVAKKSTYKLDLKGLDLKVAATVDLELVITNTSKSAIRVRTAGASPRLALTLKGPKVVEGTGPPTPKQKTTTVILKPGQKTSIPITQLTSHETAKAKFGKAASKAHHWAAPGEYTLSASFTTAVYLDYDPNKGSKLTTMTLNAKPITIKVEK